MKTKISKIGRRGKIVLVTLIAAMFISVATAAIIPHFGKITVTATVDKQAVELSADGASWLPYYEAIEHTILSVSPGGTYCFNQWVRSNAAIPVDVTFERTDSYDEEATTTYSIPLVYSFSETYLNDVTITVGENGDWLVWTFAFPTGSTTRRASVNIDYPLATTGSEICIHNNDGQDPGYPAGTWLYTNNGEIPGSGNTPVEDLWWVTATGDETGDENMVVSIHKTQINDEFHWHAYMARQGTTPIFTNYDGTTWNNFYDVNLWQPLTIPFTLQPDEILQFRICHTFDLHIGLGTYTLSTIVDAIETLTP